MALALYRSYRPQRFSDVVGQKDIADALRNQVAAGKVSHAYLFTGVRGTGKTTLAKILAKAVNCQNQNNGEPSSDAVHPDPSGRGTNVRVPGEPCGVCDICTGIDNGSVLDVTEIDAASNNGVDNIRDLRDETAYTPAVADKRVYIIDEVHMLSTGAFNALLKIMEEPPAHVMFILATTEIHKVPATILSRCQRFDLKRIPAADIAKHLLSVAKEEGIDLSEDGAEAIARLSDGALRDGLSILDTCASMGERVDEALVRRFSGAAETSHLFDLADCIAQNDIAAALGQIGVLYLGSVSPQGLTGDLLRHFRNLLVAKIGGGEALPELSKEDAVRYAEQSGAFSKARLLEVLGVLRELAASLPTATDKRLQLELALIALAGEAQRDSGNGAPAPRPEAKRAQEPIKKPDVIPMPEQAPPEPSPAPIAADETETPEEAAPLPGQLGMLDGPEPSSFAGLAGLVADEPEADTTPPAPEVEERTAEPENGVTPFAEWPRVVEAMKAKNGMLYGFMLGSGAYRSPTHILIDCGEAFKQALRDNKEYAEAIKEVILSETGVRLPIGPYTEKNLKKSKPADDPLDDLIKRATENGIPLEIE